MTAIRLVKKASNRSPSTSDSRSFLCFGSISRGLPPKTATESKSLALRFSVNFFAAPA